MPTAESSGSRGWQRSRVVWVVGIAVVAAILVATFVWGASDDSSRSAASTTTVPARADDAAAIAEFLDAIGEAVLRERLDPPREARLYAYVTLAMYRAAALSGPDSVKIEQAVGGFTVGEPAPPNINPVVSAVVAGASTARALLGDRESDLQVGALRDEIASRYVPDLRPGVFTDSLNWGTFVARRLTPVINSDGAAESLNVPAPSTDAAGSWTPTPPDHLPALLPGWGGVSRIVAVDGCEVAPPWPADERAGQLEQLTALAPTDSSIESARRWAEVAGETTSVAARWVDASVARSVAKGDSLLDTTRRAAGVGIAVHSAFVVSMAAQYEFMAPRPVTVAAESGSSWEPALAAPPSPEYPAPEVIGARAAAAVLGDGALQFGSGDDRTEYDDASAAAQSVSDGRIDGGVNFPKTVEASEKVGTCLGEGVGAALTP